MNHRALHLLQKSVRLSGVEVSGNGSSRQVNVGVQSLIGAHGIPALSPIYSLRQLWVQIEIYNANNQLILASGDLDSYGDLKDEHSLMVKQGMVQKDAYLSIFQFRNIIKTSEQQQAPEHPAVYQFDRTTEAKNTIQPLENRIVSYPIMSSGQVTVNVKLRFRSLPPYAMRLMDLEWVNDEVSNYIIDQEEVVFQ